MAFLRDFRAARRDEAELGLGVWRRAHDREGVVRLDYDYGRSGTTKA